MMNRRAFLRGAGVVAGGAVFAGRGVLGANGDIRAAVIGLGNKGGQHAQMLSGLDGVRLVGLCEVDPKRLAKHMASAVERGARPEGSSDPRRVMERDDVDVVFIAAPNHWHALLTVWALRAGKHVYVEKPVSHSLWEGERMLEEARRSGKLVQAGTQYRSCPGLRGASAWLAEGHLGKPLWGQVVWYEHREPIGRVAGYYPEGLDYDLWCGPSVMEPLKRPKLHYDWHWVWSTGDGDLANSGIHALDACRMFLPGAVYPDRVVSVGGRFTYDDAAETPNTQFTALDYGGLPVVIENRNLSTVTDGVVMGDFRRIREGIVVQYEGGYFAGLRTGGEVYDNEGRSVRKFRGDGGGGHHANFFAALRSGRAGDLNAPLEGGVVSWGFGHWGTWSSRWGRAGGVAECRAVLGGGEVVEGAFGRTLEALAGLGLKTGLMRFRVGAALNVDRGSGEITRAGDVGMEVVRGMVRGHQRAPFEFPA